MRQTTVLNGVLSRAQKINNSVDRGTVRLAAFTMAGVIAGSALAYALVNDRPASNQPQIAAAEPGSPQGPVELATLAPAGLIDAGPLIPLTNAAQTLPAPDEMSATNEVVVTTAAVAATPAPERFGAVDAIPQETSNDEPMLAASVEFAATQEDVLAIEMRLAAAGDPNFVLPPETGDSADATPEIIIQDSETTNLAALDEDAATSMSDGRSDLVPAQAARYVNLRDAPDNDSGVIRVVPAGAAIMVEADCPNWCAVTHEGTRGYIYQSFIDRDGS